MKEETYTFVVMMFDIVYLVLLQFLNPVIIFYSRERHRYSAHENDNVIPLVVRGDVWRTFCLRSAPNRAINSSNRSGLNSGTLLLSLA